MLPPDVNQKQRVPVGLGGQAAVVIMGILPNIAAHLQPIVNVRNVHGVDLQSAGITINVLLCSHWVDQTMNVQRPIEI